MFQQTAFSLLTKQSQIPVGFLLKFQEVVMFYPSTKYASEDFICLLHALHNDYTTKRVKANNKN